MGDQPVEGQAPVVECIAHRDHVRLFELRRHAQMQLAHEGGWKIEADGRLVETREDDLATAGEAPISSSSSDASPLASR
jgi:hypothetical protein